MADKTLTITAPEELLDAVVAAYAAKGRPEDGQTDEELAIEMIVDHFGDEVVAHAEQQANEALHAATRESRLANREAAKVQREALTARRAEVQVTIE